MKDFMKPINERTWVFILTKPSLVDESGIKTLKLKTTQTTKEDKLVNANLKALNAIFNRVDPQEFKHISKCTVAKEALTILESTHEGTNIVKQSKLQTH